jgi:hypothetical protein
MTRVIFVVLAWLTLTQGATIFRVGDKGETTDPIRTIVESSEWPYESVDANEGATRLRILADGTIAICVNGKVQSDRMLRCDTKGIPLFGIYLDGDGVLCAFDGKGKEYKLSSNPNETGGAYEFTIEQDATCYIRDGNNKCIWSFPDGLAMQHIASDANNILRCGDTLSSEDGKWSLIIQKNGSVCINGPKGSTTLCDKPGKYLKLSDDGTLNFYDDEHNVVWNNGPQRLGGIAPFTMRLCNSGMLDICDGNEVRRGTPSKCDQVGRCSPPLIEHYLKSNVMQHDMRPYTFTETYITSHIACGHERTETEISKYVDSLNKDIRAQHFPDPYPIMKVDGILGGSRFATNLKSDVYPPKWTNVQIMEHKYSRMQSGIERAIKMDEKAYKNYVEKDMSPLDAALKVMDQYEPVHRKSDIYPSKWTDAQMMEHKQSCAKAGIAYATKLNKKAYTSYVEEGMLPLDAARKVMVLYKNVPARLSNNPNLITKVDEIFPRDAFLITDRNDARYQSKQTSVQIEERDSLHEKSEIAYAMKLDKKAYTSYVEEGVPPLDAACRVMDQHKPVDGDVHSIHWDTSSKVSDRSIHTDSVPYSTYISRFKDGSHRRVRAPVTSSEAYMDLRNTISKHLNDQKVLTEQIWIRGPKKNKIIITTDDMLMDTLREMCLIRMLYMIKDTLLSNDEWVEEFHVKDKDIGCSIKFMNPDV